MAWHFAILSTSLRIHYFLSFFLSFFFLVPLPFLFLSLIENLLSSSFFFSLFPFIKLIYRILFFFEKKRIRKENLSLFLFPPLASPPCVK